VFACIALSLVQAATMVFAVVAGVPLARPVAAARRPLDGR
jgi:hypothetical protein